ncbi:MAG: TPM domain-containing protein [Aquincola sp.]|nr:TPM domain-containing protein [Aquincola sp.]MDH4289206.1 TPM domain-containing protein [Aquincola sp.]MDH5331565.1 TPM domain-containing protein [Aquincola sp.]
MTALRRLALLLLLLCTAAFVAAQEPLPVPALTERVIDQTGTLSAEQRQRLVDKLAAFERDAGPQIVVLMVASTQPEDIAAYAQRVGETWKIGRRDVGDGLLLLVAKNDRRLWIAPAKALEGAVPDLAARQIAQNTISPRFKTGDFAGGIEAGLDQLIARIKGENLPAPGADKRGGDRGLLQGFDPFEIFMFAFIALPIVAAVLRGMLGRGLGSLATGAAGGGIAWLVTQSILLGVVGGVIGLLIALFGGLGSALRTRSGRHDGWVGTGGWSGGGGGWGGGGGGGFSSGGGGDFGGGGAGGDW